MTQEHEEPRTFPVPDPGAVMLAAYLQEAGKTFEDLGVEEQEELMARVKAVNEEVE